MNAIFHFIFRSLPVIAASIVLGLSLLMAQASAQELKFFRYKNAEGITVISTQIPSQFISKGYDIVTSSGRLIERVPAEPTAEEKQRILEAQAEAERQKKQDRELLSLYGRVEDIEADRTRKLAQIDANLKLRERNVNKVNEDITLWQSKAADEERRGQQVSTATLDKLARLREQKNSILLTIEQKRNERKDVMQKFEKYIARFKVIRPE